MSKPSILRCVQTPGAVYDQIENGVFDNNVDELQGIPAGYTQPLFTGGMKFTHRISGDVTNLATLLTEAPSPWGTDLSGGNVDLYLVAAGNLGTRQSGSVHQRFRAASNCCMYYTSISAQSNQPAKASVMWMPVSVDGGNPITSAGSAALPSMSAGNEYFGLSDLYLNGTLLTGGVTGWTLNTNISREVIYTDGGIFANFSFTNFIAPTIELNVLDMGLWQTLSMEGAALTSLTMCLQRYKPNSNLFYGKAESQHITINASVGKITPGSMNGGRNRADNKITITLVGEDASTDCFTVATGQAID